MFRQKAIGIFTAISLYFILIETSVFESSSKLSIKHETPNIELSIFGGINQSGKEAYELREYILSDEGLIEIIDLLDLNPDMLSGFDANVLDINKKYFQSQKKYLKRFINIDIDETNGIIHLNTRAYNAESAFFLNKLILILMQYYFDKKISSENYITSTNALCNLSRSTIFSDDFRKLMDESSIDLLRNSDINNVFVEINQIRRDQCLEEINIDKNATIDMLPQEFRTQVNSEQYEFLIKEFMKSEKIVNFSSDKISLISLPQKANQPINNQPLLKILISTLLIFLTLLSINLSKLIIRNLS